MRITTLLVVTSLGAAIPLHGQAALQLTAGATSSAALVNDGVAHVNLRPALAPTIGIALALPTGKGPYRVRLETHVSRSNLQAVPTGAASDNLGTLTTVDALVMAEGPLLGKLRWQIGGGTIFYHPAENQGVFLDGPVHRWLVAGGVVFSQRLTPHLAVLVNGRVDAHSFLTDVLLARGYAGSQGVRRFALNVGLERVL